MTKFLIHAFAALPNEQSLGCLRVLSIEMMIDISFNLIIYSCYISLKMSPVEMHDLKQVIYAFWVLPVCQFLSVKTSLNQQMAKTSFCWQKSQPSLTAMIIIWVEWPPSGKCTGGSSMCSKRRCWKSHNQDGPGIGAWVLSYDPTPSSDQIKTYTIDHAASSQRRPEDFLEHFIHARYSALQLKWPSQRFHLYSIYWMHF